MSQRISSWSYSRWSTYQTCPAKAKYQIIDRLPMQESEAMQRGKLLHSLCEGYLRGSLNKCPSELRLISPLLAKLRKQKAEPEVEMCFNADWQPVEWMAKDAWLRLKIDALSHGLRVLKIYDWKTGRQREGYGSQLDLYGLAGLLAYPEIDEVHAGLVYIDQAGKLVMNKYKRADIPRLKGEWLKATRAMLSDETFVPTPNNLCGWCDYRKQRGGPCQF